MEKKEQFVMTTSSLTVVYALLISAIILGILLCLVKNSTVCHAEKPPLFR